VISISLGFRYPVVLFLYPVRKDSIFLADVAVEQIFSPVITLYSILLRHYTNESIFKASALQGADVISKRKFLLLPYCIMSDVEPESGEL
jgi:hypothetical protein